MNEERNRFEDVKPADALGTIARRMRASRFSTLAIGVVGLILLALLAGFMFRFVLSGATTPDVPRVEL